MEVLKKVLMGLGIAIAAIILIGLIAIFVGLYQVSVPPKLEVESVTLVDHDGYPAVKGGVRDGQVSREVLPHDP